MCGQWRPVQNVLNRPIKYISANIPAWFNAKTIEESKTRLHTYFVVVIIIIIIISSIIISSSN